MFAVITLEARQNCNMFLSSSLQQANRKLIIFSRTELQPQRSKDHIHGNLPPFLPNPIPFTDVPRLITWARLLWGRAGQLASGSYGESGAHSVIHFSILQGRKHIYEYVRCGTMVPFLIKVWCIWLFVLYCTAECGEARRVFSIYVHWTLFSETLSAQIANGGN